MDGSSYPHDGVPGGPASEPYARNVGDYRCVTTDWNPGPSTPFQSTTAQTSIPRTGEGYLYLPGYFQEDIDTTDFVGSRSETYGAGSGEPARGDTIGYKSYTLANALQEIPAEKTSATQASPPSAPPVQEMPPTSSLPLVILSAPMVEPTAPLPMEFPTLALSPEVRPDPRTIVLECLQGPPLKFKCPLGCDVELAAQEDGLSLHLSDYHKNLLDNGWMVDCPVPGCTVRRRWANFHVHLLEHLKKLRGDYVWCRDCGSVMKATSAPSHLSRHKKSGPSRSTSKGEAARKMAPENSGGKPKPHANSSNAAKRPARPGNAPGPSGPSGSARWA